MNCKCQVILSSQLESVKISKLNFKKEWAEILMDTEEIQDHGMISDKTYKVQGTLFEISCGRGIVVIEKGIILQIPLEFIKLEIP